MFILIEASAMIDGEGFACAPAGAIVELDRPDGLWIGPDAGRSWSRAHLVAAGPLNEIRRRSEAIGATRIDLHGHVLLPGLVNAHTHLDLTHIGPREHDLAGGFVGFAKIVVPNRRRDDAGIADSVQRGIELSLAGGVVAVGDIAGMVPPTVQLAPAMQMRKSPLMGVSFLEYFGVSKSGEESLPTALRPFIEMMQSGAGGDERVRIGLSPHAPYTVGEAGYRFAMKYAAQRGEVGVSSGGVPVSTHLAESMQERDAVVHARGAMIELLKMMNLWDAHAAAWFGKVPTSVERLREFLGGSRESGRFTASAAFTTQGRSVVHCNDVSDSDLDTLARSDASVIYCPRSSAYFQHERDFGPHRYQDMLARGINVALGTDSVVNLPNPDPRGPISHITRLSTLDEMRLLHRRDGTDPVTLLRMATTNAARAIGLSAGAFAFSRVDATAKASASTPAAIAGLAAIELLRPCSSAIGALGDVMLSEHQPRLVLIGADRA